MKVNMRIKMQLKCRKERFGEKTFAKAKHQANP